MIAAVRRLWRLPQVIALLFGGLFTVIVLFPFWREPARRTAIRVWSRMLLAGCGLRLSECTAPGARPLHALPPGAADVPLQALVLERAVSTNTAAAGGNASLMMIG